MFNRRREKLREEIKGFKDILRATQAVVSSLDLDQTLANILRSAMEIMSVPAGSIALYDEHRQELKLRAQAGLSAFFTARDCWRVQRGGLTDQILRRDRPFIIQDLELSFDVVPWPIAAEGIRALVAIPLKIQYKTVGLLYLDDFVPRRFSPRRLRLLSILSTFAAMSIANARLHEQMRHLAWTDGLTGLQNHRRFQQRLREEIGRAERYGKRFALFMVDIDDFKKFNDTYGHPKGDEALVVFSDLLRGSLRDCDQVFRYGGEEFVVILPEVGLAEALIAAERARAVIEAESERRLRRLGARGLTASAGVAAFPRDGDDAETLLVAVDRLMYRAKQSGKNKVYHHPEPTLPFLGGTAVPPEIGVANLPEG